MRKIELHSYMTLDGRAEFPNYPGSDEDDPDSAFTEMWIKHYDSIDTIILGRRAYEDWAAYWPMSKRKETDSDFILEFRRFTDRSQKIVFSNNLKHTNWENSRIMAGDISEAVTQLKKEPGKNMAIGGGPMIAHAFMQRGLIDEYYLTVFPVIYGQGKAHFGDMLNQQTLKLVESRTFKHGEVFLHYAKIGE